MTSRTLRLSLVAAIGVTALAACAPPAKDKGSDGGSGNAATATSADEAGGMDALVAAAKKEGSLNVIALPPDWANYGEIIDGFEKEYDITVNSDSPDVSSAEEITAAQNLKGQDTAPDVFDLGSAVTLANLDQFAPYKVATWGDIADGEGTTFPAGHPFTGRDAYGAFAYVKLKPGAANVGFIVVNKDGVKDTDGDRFIDLTATGEVWVEQGSPDVATSPPAGVTT